MRKDGCLFRLMTVMVAVAACLSFVWAEDNARIDINSAPAEELMQLKGIGQKKAAAIIEFRDKNGPFERPEDLVKVPGIGPKTYEANKDRIAAKKIE